MAEVLIDLPKATASVSQVANPTASLTPVTTPAARLLEITPTGASPSLNKDKGRSKKRRCLHVNTDVFLDLHNVGKKVTVIPWGHIVSILLSGQNSIRCTSSRPEIERAIHCALLHLFCGVLQQLI